VRRLVTYTAAWAAAAVVAVVLAWQGVGIVTRQVTEDRPQSLSAGEVGDLASQANPAPDPSASTTSTTAPAPPTTAPPATTGTAAAAETRTYNVVGGSVTLRFAPEGVTVVLATPNPGFAVAVEPEHGNGVKVEFDGDSHRSRVDGWWESGPHERVREDAT
jgi:hypothetical protein